jgi:hypothetical protein
MEVKVRDTKPLPTDPGPDRGRGRQAFRYRVMVAVKKAIFQRDDRRYLSTVRASFLCPLYYRRHA